MAGERPLVAIRDLVARTTGRTADGSREPATCHVAGAAGSMPALVARAMAARGRPVVCVTSDAESARRLTEDLQFIAADILAESGQLVALLPPETSPYADVSPDRRGAMARLGALARLAGGAPWRILVVPVAALVRKVVPRDLVLRHSTRIVAEENLDRDRFIAALSIAGYLRLPIVEDPGTFAVRGSIIDLWPTAAVAPVRIELYGDLVVSIRTFDPTLQRSELGAAEKLVDVPPAREAIVTLGAADRARDIVRGLCDAIDLPTSRARALSDDVASGRSFFGADGFLPAYQDLEPLAAYLPHEAILVVDDPASITRAVRAELERAEIDERGKQGEAHLAVDALYASEVDAANLAALHDLVLLHRSAISGGAVATGFERFEIAPQNVPSLAASDQSDLVRGIAAARASSARSTGAKHGGLEPLAERLRDWEEQGLHVVLVARAETQAERLVQLLDHRGIKCRLHRDAASPSPPGARIPFDRIERGARDVVVGGLARGVVAPSEGLVLVTEEEIFGQRAHRSGARRPARPARAFLEDLRALAVGDHVVHVDHGIGRYRGLIHKNIGGVTVDLIVVEYQGGDKLYLPVYRLNQLEKWAGGEATPKLDRLGGQTFSKTKARVAQEAKQLADELLRLYAERQAIVADVVPPIDDDYRAFEATFPFEETPDQSRAIAEVLADLEMPKPMDRLVCGDVGFGKTEVAIRAAFRVVQAGRQVAVLCPTTVLAQQHFLSFDGRMEPYAMRVAALSRFQSSSEQADVVRRLKEGTLDVVVGTHRLLSKDVHFKNLGLLVIDEEQRFGVTHKERIKQLKTNVGVLTLTATPIPRTLQMAVTSLRDMSLITTPPADRRAVRTMVMRPDPAVVREAVTRELSRGGQTFYVYNRVGGVYERAARLQELVPEARIAVAHGQMSEASLEQTMIDFVEGRYDVLVCTAIIESGLDIPRANTIIIDRADTFGLGQLYQLRGRVGRAKERGYCYLVVPPASKMTDEARQRIEAIEQYTELGSGFQIATLDLELRGAGDLLGAEQSGTVAAVGFDLFCRMLEDAVHELRGEPVIHEVEPELSFDVEALIADDYVSDVGVRLSLYKRLASAVDEQEVADLGAELENRFGPPPEATKRLVELMRLKTELRRLRVLGCEASARSVTLHLRQDTPLDATELAALVARRGSPYKLTPDMRLTRKMTENDLVRDGLAACEKVLVELAACMTNLAGDGRGKP